MVYNYIFKILILGDSNVGKSSIHHILEHGFFTRNINPTIGIEFMTKYVHINDVIIKCQVWDASGDERFEHVINTYIKDNIGIVLVFDKNNYTSFSNLNGWIEKIHRESDECYMPRILLVGNKSDKESKISRETIEKFVKNHGCDYVETNINTVETIKFAFARFIKKLYKSNDILIIHPGVKLGIRKIINLQPAKKSICQKLLEYLKN